MSTQPQSTASGTFAPVDYEPVRTDQELDLDNLSAEEREVVTANEFVVFGRCNIEQWDDPAPGDDPIYIEMEALKANLDQLFALENISWQHGDIRVGEPLESYTLDAPTTVHLDRDKSLSFDAGDTLRTQVIRAGDPLPDESGTADEDALWLVANIYGRDDPGGSRLSQSIRLGSYYGDLDGFSVTVDKLEVTPQDDGLVVHDVDFLAVTIGPDDLIKNPGSTYGVVTYEMLFTETDDAPTTPVADTVARAGAEDLGTSRTNNFLTTTMRSIYRHLFGKSQAGLATETIRTAQTNEIGLYEAAAEVAPDEADRDQIASRAEEQLQEIHERLKTEADDMDRETLAAEVADDLGMDKEEVMAIMDTLDEQTGDASSSDTDDPEDDANDVDQEQTPDQDQPPDEADAVEQAQNGPTIESDRDLAEFIADVKDVPVDEAMVMLDDLDGDGVATRSELIEEAVEEAVETRLEKAAPETDEPAIDTDRFVTEDQLDERLDDLNDRIGDQLDDLGENVAESLSQQLRAATTPDPAGGNATGEADLEDEIDEMASDLGAEVN